MSLFTIKIPSMGESVSQAVIARLLKKEGDWVDVDQELLEIETDKVNQMIASTASGALHWLVNEGDTVLVGQEVAQIDASAKSPAKSDSKVQTFEVSKKKTSKSSGSKKSANEANHEATVPLPESMDKEEAKGKLTQEKKLAAVESHFAARISKEEYLKSLEISSLEFPAQPAATVSSGLHEIRSPLSQIRKTIADRLLQAKQQTAMLTTFNEVDMSVVISYRERHQQEFLERHKVKLGFMSFFIKASVEALKKFPAIHARIEGSQWVQSLDYHLGIAVSTERGLVVPVLRNCDTLSIADIEKTLTDAASRAREGKIRLEELTGGSFTITNGGVFGSLLSTPIINPPQSAILGMHKIQKRPVVDSQDQIVVRPMMYLALSYDHRIVDGKEAVGFLSAIKDAIEQPERIWLEL